MNLPTLGRASLPSHAVSCEMNSTTPDPTSTVPSWLRPAAASLRIASLLWLLVMFVATHWPLPNIQISITYYDKIVHAVAYATLAIFLLSSWELSAGWLRPQHYFAVWLFCVLYGAFDEISQTPFGRTCDGLDWVADVGGTVLGLILYRLMRPQLGRLFLRPGGLQ